MVTWLLSILFLLSPAPRPAHAAAPVKGCVPSYSMLELPAKEMRRRKLELYAQVNRELDSNFYDLNPSPELAAATGKKVLTAEQADEWNKAVLRTSRNLPYARTIRGRRGYLTEKEIHALYRKIEQNPVTNFEILDKYDPTDVFGFCFGRAFNAHREALNSGLSKDSIKRVWVVGSMKSDEEGLTQPWAHHVATMVRSEGGNWWILDPYMEKATTLKEWWKEMKSSDLRDNLLLLTSDGRRFGVDSSQPIFRSSVTNPNYNNYFLDLMALAREEAREVMTARRKEAEKLRRQAERRARRNKAQAGE